MLKKRHVKSASKQRNNYKVNQKNRSTSIETDKKKNELLNKKEYKLRKDKQTLIQRSRQTNNSTIKPIIIQTTN